MENLTLKEIEQFKRLGWSDSDLEKLQNPKRIALQQKRRQDSRYTKKADEKSRVVLKYLDF